MLGRLRLNRLHAALVLGLLLALGLGVWGLKLHGQCGALRAEVGELSRKAALAGKRYVEQRALFEQQLRERSALAGLKGMAEEELARLKTESDGLKAEQARLKAEVASLQAALREAAAAQARMKTGLAESQEQHQAAQQEVKRLAAEKAGLAAELKSVRQSLERCKGHNARLCAIAAELMQAYRDKGVVGALLAKEPVTRLKQVEMEQLMQEYRERIERERLERQQK